MSGFLVIRGGAIGDFVLTLPALRLLREQFPQTRLEVLGYRHIVELVDRRFYADKVRSIEYAGMASFFVPSGKLPPEWADYFASFGQVISYLYDPDGFFEGNLRRAGVKNLISAYRPLTEDAHASAQLARPLEQLALFLEPGDEQARLHPSTADQALALGRLAATPSLPLIALHPGSGGKAKLWPLASWLTLVEDLSRLPLRLLIIGGEADAERFQPLLERAGANAIAAWQLPLTELAALLEHATLYIGHDTGVSHLAAAVGAPSLLLFGPTRPEVWAPVGPHVEVMEAPGGALGHLSPQSVLAAVVRKLKGTSGNWGMTAPNVLTQ